jgi:hypothetical protein
MTQFHFILVGVVLSGLAAFHFLTPNGMDNQTSKQFSLIKAEVSPFKQPPTLVYLPKLAPLNSVTNVAYIRADDGPFKTKHDKPVVFSNGGFGGVPDFCGTL